MRDQHGRRWHASFDIRAGDIVDTPSPVGWTAPVIPPAPFMRSDPEEPSVLTIKYSEWMTSLRNRHRERMVDLEQALTQAYGAKEARRMIKENDPEVNRKFPPLTDPRLVRACQAKDPWILGFTDVMPKWAEDVPPQYPKYASLAEDEFDKLLESMGADFADAGRESDEQVRSVEQMRDEEAERLRYEFLEKIDFEDEEEQHDPEAQGGKVQKVKKRNVREPVN